MSLNSDIAGIISNLSPDATYILSSWFKADVKSYKLTIDELTVDAPFIILNNEQSEDVEIQQNMNYLVSTEIKILFLLKTSLYDSPQELEDAIEGLKPLTSQVENNIYQLNSMRLKGSELAKFKRVKRFDIFNSVLSGWELTSNWKYNEVANWCQVEQKTDNFISTDVPGVNVADDFIPVGTETIHES